MPLISHQILAETNDTIIIKFSAPTGKELIKTVKKIDGMTNERLAEIWHFRMTMKYIEKSVSKNRLKRTILQDSSDEITIKFEKRNLA